MLPEEQGFIAFAGSGNRLDGKKKRGIWDDLPGAKKDVTDMKARMEVNGYKVKVIENSPDILQDIKEEMNMTPVSSVSHLQLLYVGE